MPSLKDLKDRIGSVKNTQKITSAMKMVAAAKLRKAQDRALKNRDYTERLNAILANLAANIKGNERSLLTGNGGAKEKTRLIICATADRGLCGGFNSSLIKGTIALANRLQKQGVTVKIMCVGSKGHDVLKREHANKIIKTYSGLTRNLIEYKDAKECAEYAIEQFEKGTIDGCTLIYNKFISAISQTVTEQSLIPLQIESADKPKSANDNIAKSTYEFEPSEEEILEELLPKNLAVQIFGGLLENAASEQGARMSAMDNATRNAGEMIKKLTLQYNRSRQAAITKELIEIISGAEAL